MSVLIKLMGGPKDGLEILWTADRLPPTFHVPAPFEAMHLANPEPDRAYQLRIGTYNLTRKGTLLGAWAEEAPTAVGEYDWEGWR